LNYNQHLDLITAFHIFENFRFPEEEQRYRALQSMGRALNDGGFLVVGYPYAPELEAINIYQRQGNRLVYKPVDWLKRVDVGTYFPDGVDLAEKVLSPSEAWIQQLDKYVSTSTSNM